jgi:hypothetical protein
MSNCKGYGTCIQQCICICYENDETDIPLPECKCGHRGHEKIIGGNEECDIYCKEQCPHNCQLVECTNYWYCGKKMPFWLKDCHDGCCDYCAVMLGKMTQTNKIDECPVCMESKELITVCYGKHNICVDCWKQMSECQTNKPLSCPLCRKQIFS